MGDPFDFFDRIFCINLDHRTDRWATVQKEFELNGLLHRVERFSAIESDDGWDGALKSHIGCIQLAQASGADNVLIFEDDAVFGSDTRSKLKPALEQLHGQPWELFYLGGQVVDKPDEIWSHLFRGRMYQTHAYAVNSSAYDKALQAQRPVDVWFPRNMVSFGVRPPLIFQVDGFSDISDCELDRGILMQREYDLYVGRYRHLSFFLPALLRARRQLGHWLVRQAARMGVQLRFVNGMPRFGAKVPR